MPRGKKSIQSNFSSQRSLPSVITVKIKLLHFYGVFGIWFVDSHQHCKDMIELKPYFMVLNEKTPSNEQFMSTMVSKEIWPIRNFCEGCRNVFEPFLW